MGAWWELGSQGDQVLHSSVSLSGQGGEELGIMGFGPIHFNSEVV